MVSGAEVPRAIRRAGLEAPQQLAELMPGIVLLELTADIIAGAARLGLPPLRSLDAIHIASALELGSDLAAFVTYDARQADAARGLGLAVESPG